MRQGIGSALVLIVLLFFTPSLEAQNAATPAPAAESASANLKAGRPAPRRIVAVRAVVPPVIDARIDEAVWAQAQVATDFTTLEPKPGEAASEQTEVRVLYDDDAIYVAARLFDRTPDSIVARLARRDNDVYSEWFYVGLDSYNDRRTAFIFAVNPRGVKLDSFMSEDGQREDGGWDPVWDVAADVDALGWTAEMRIPLSQLRFSASADQGAEERVWGITFARRIARTQEFAFWSPLLPDAPGVVSQFGYLEGLRGLRAPRRLEALPYSVARVTRAPGEAGNPFYDRTEPYASVGADVKYGLTSDLTLSATVNPDFGQVEADPSVVNLSAYETFFSERRPFFVEGSDIFRFGIEPGDGGSQQLFYSRRIGRAPQRSVELDDGHVDAPEGTTILGAAKVSGKTRGGWSIGVLEALTGAEYARTSDARGRRGSALVEPLTNYAMLRAKKDFRAGESTVGAIVTGTHRKLDDDALDFLRSAAYAGGVDFRHRFGRGNYEVRGYMLGSTIEGDTVAIQRVQRSSTHYFQRPDAEHLRYDPARTSLAGLAADLRFSKMAGGHWRWGFGTHTVSPGFEVNDLGFLREADFTSQYTFLGYDQFEPGKLFRRWNLFTNQWNAWSYGGEHVSVGGNINGSWELVNFWGGWGGINREFDRLVPEALRGGPALVVPARTEMFLGVYSDSRKPVRLELEGSASFEDETGGRSLRFGPELELRLADGAEISLEPSLSSRRDPWQYIGQRSAGGETHYIFGGLRQTTASLSARASYTFSPTLSLQLYAQPFISAGRYADFREVEDPRAQRFEQRFHTYAPSELSYDAAANRYNVSRDGASYGFDNPAFNFKQFRSNLVLRWEYRPGSTLFLVWSQGRTRARDHGSFDLGRDLEDLFEAESTNVLLIKASYWLDF